MAGLDFTDIARLLNNDSRNHFNIEPIRKDSGWSLYEGYNIVRNSKDRFEVLYLNSSATREELNTAAKEVYDQESIEVVYPPSLDDRQSLHHDLFKRAERGFYTTKEYLRSSIGHELDTYIANLKEQAPDYYIEPRFQDGRLKRPNPIGSFLTKQETLGEDAEGGLGILLAEPGQGKTYMSRHLVATIPEHRPDLVPILVTSKQWDRMLVKDQKSIWKTITHSFRFFDATIGWLDGHEDQFLEGMLKADLFRIVFDGFDEYILRNRGAIQPLDVLETLSSVAEETGTRIVITSRTSFWRSNLPEESMNDFLDKTNTEIFRIQPFDLQHAKNYFKKRLVSKNAGKRAERLYKKLEGKNEELVGRGFVLSLIADAAKNDIDLNSKSEKSSALFWLIEALCRREETRQELPFTAEQQIDMMRRLAAAIAKDGEDIADTESLMVLMAEAREGLDKLSQKTAVEKFILHPLLFKNDNSNLWTFTQVQVEMALLADHVINILSSEKLADFFNKLRLSAEMIQDLVTIIVDLVVDQSESEIQSINKLSSIVNIAIKAHAKDKIKRESGLASTLTLGVVEKFRPPKSNSTRTERANLLLEVCGSKKITGLNFSGTIRSFDFRGITFDHCHFEKLTWANCRFNEETQFKNCEFIGGIPPQYCEGFGKANFKNLTRDQVATTWIDNERVKEGMKEYTSHDLRNDIHCVIKKFIRKGGIKFAKVRGEDLRRGPISRSPFKDEIMDNLTTNVICKYESAGSSEYEIRKEAEEDIKFFASNNNFTGLLNKSYETLKNNLELR